MADRPLRIHLLRYKDHAETISEWVSSWDTNWEVDIIDGVGSLVSNSDVVISCITHAEGNLVDDSCFRPGCLVVPVHFGGFLNCDHFFDKVFADDMGHVESVRNSKCFRYLGEFATVLAGDSKGRENEVERILSYNIGIAIHDVVCAYEIYRLLCN